MAEALEFLRRLSTEGGAIVSSGACSVMEIACARAGGRFFVDPETGCGYVLRPEKWREIAAAAIDLSAARTEGDTERLAAAELAWGQVYPAD